jgi:hypothetical protein
MLWMRIKVADITGKNAIASSHAQRLYTILRLELSTQWQPTTLDFAGVDVALCLFFHTAIGQLYEDLPVEYVDRKLKIVGMNQAIATTYNLCKESWTSALTQN